jgi:transcriptional regulator with XRE-family HTH domain
VAGSVFNDRYRAFITLLARERRARGVTQEQLAKRLSKPQSFVSKVERCERRLDIIEFCLFAEALEFPPDCLLAKLLSDLS